ncbi:MAG TPA: excalibur calcium-binding domain-containing protein [Actinopolymorphaceae bacterium]
MSGPHQPSPPPAGQQPPHPQPESWLRRFATGRGGFLLYGVLLGAVLVSAGRGTEPTAPVATGDPSPAVTVTAPAEPVPAETVEVPGPTVTVTVPERRQSGPRESEPDQGPEREPEPKKRTKPKSEPKPEPEPESKPEPEPDTDPRFRTCGEANDHGYGPYVEGEDPEYDWYIDRDRDGVVCER